MNGGKKYTNNTYHNTIPIVKQTMQVVCLNIFGRKYSSFPYLKYIVYFITRLLLLYKDISVNISAEKKVKIMFKFGSTFTHYLNHGKSFDKKRKKPTFYRERRVQDQLEVM